MPTSMGPTNGFSCLLSDFWLSALESSSFSSVFPSNTGKGENTLGFACRGSCSCLESTVGNPNSARTLHLSYKFILEMTACAVVSLAY